MWPFKKRKVFVPPTDEEARAAVRNVVERAERAAYGYRSGREFRISLQPAEIFALMYHIGGFSDVRERAVSIHLELLTNMSSLRGARLTSLKFRKK